MRQGEIIKKFTSKSGKEIVLRTPQQKDISQLLSMINSVIEERDFILATKKITLREEREWMANSLKKIRANRKLLVVAEANGKIIGNSGIDKKTGTREHVGEFGITLMEGFRSEGIGQIMMEEVLRLAKKVLSIKLVTLEVYNTNKRAQKLYKKMGFKKVGIMPKAINRRGKLIPEIIMYKEL